MKKIAERLTDLVGNTPLLELNNYNKNKSLKARVIAKLEYFNPAGSVKDRVYNPQNEMFATFQTKRYFIQNETSSKK